jgi:hypothetical protein
MLIVAVEGAIRVVSCSKGGKGEPNTGDSTCKLFHDSSLALASGRLLVTSSFMVGPSVGLVCNGPQLKIEQEGVRWGGG